MSSITNSTKLYEEKIMSLLPMALLLTLHTRNNTDGNKPMIYMVVLFYADTYNSDLFIKCHIFHYKSINIVVYKQTANTPSNTTKQYTSVYSKSNFPAQFVVWIGLVYFLT